MAPTPPLLLLVEDTLPVARAFMKRAETLGWKVVWADRLDDARSLVARITFDAWVLDRQLGPDEGMTLVREHELAEKTGLRRRRPAAVLWTSRPDEPPGDIDEYDVHVFGKTDTDALLTHLAARLPPPLRQALRS